jgi:PIN domain nuclease of toxin-antitoxin system
LIALDSYAVLAFLKEERAAARVERLLRHASDSYLTVLGVAEVIDHLVRLAGVDEDDAVLDVAALELGPSHPLTSGIALRAGILRARYYDRRVCAVSLADCVLIETARADGSRVATSDPHLLDVCAAEKIRVIPLPGNDGTEWSPLP